MSSVPATATPSANPYFTNASRVVNEELGKFFSSTKKCQQLFIIDAQKVGIVFDPSGKNCVIDTITLRPIVLISEGLNPETFNKIKALAPKNFGELGRYTIPIDCSGRYTDLFKDLGLK